MAGRAAKHTHKFVVIGYAKDPKRPSILRACLAPKCIETEVVCPLCEEDGNRRRHKKHHAPVTDRAIFHRALLALTKAAIEYEKRWGKPVFSLKDGSCGLHGREHWTSREDKAAGHYACELCHPSGMNGHDHSICPGGPDADDARPVGRADVGPVDDGVLEAAAH
jgi:hypothetical protein